jgi:hypothetical protein
MSTLKGDFGNGSDNGLHFAILQSKGNLIILLLFYFVNST